MEPPLKWNNIILAAKIIACVCRSWCCVIYILLEFFLINAVNCNLQNVKISQSFARKWTSLSSFEVVFCIVFRAVETKIKNNLKWRFFPQIFWRTEQLWYFQCCTIPVYCLRREFPVTCAEGEAKYLLWIALAAALVCVRVRACVRVRVRACVRACVHVMQTIASKILNDLQHR